MLISKFHRPGKRGFTLIELMIVIAIIAILAAVAIPNFMSARDKARRTGAKQSLGALRKAMEMYLAERDDYPTELAGTTVDEDTADFVNSLGRYTNVTQLLSAVRDTDDDGMGEVSFPTVVGGTRYTIQAVARDRTATPVTATPDVVCDFIDGPLSDAGTCP